MVERLKQIWSGFEATTTRNLTGKGVDNIVTPRRADYAAEDWQFLPEDFEAPSERAFDALARARGRPKKKFGGEKAGRGRPAEPDAPASMAAQRPGGDDLIRGLKATAMRVERTEVDYERFLASDAGKAIRKKTRKKRFGIF